jgi:hypothetical protein
MSLIDKMSVKVGNSTVVSEIPNISQYLNFRLMTELSQEDEMIWGDIMNFKLDTPDAWSYNATASPNGMGLCNNVFMPSQLNNCVGNNGRYVNEGAYQRSLKYQTKGESKKAVFFTDDKLQTMGLDYIDNVSATVKNYYIMAFIRLRDIPFFRDLPLLYGTLFSITVSINQGSVSITKAATTGTLTQSNNTFNSGTACPILFSASVINPIIAASTGVVSTTTTNTTTTYYPSGSANITEGNVVINLGVVSASSNGTSYKHFIDKCRIYIPTYKLDDQVLQNYLAMGIKKHVYSNVLYNVFNVSAGNSFTQIINTRSRIQRIIIVPELSQSANAALIQQKYSPFDIFPCGTAPCGAQLISKLRLLVGGKSVWETERNYGFEEFLFETQNYGINGGLSSGLSSGRISKLGFDNQHSYIVCNIRNSALDYNKPMEISICGTSLCRTELILNVWVEYESSCDFDLTTGAMSNFSD